MRASRYQPRSAPRAAKTRGIRHSAAVVCCLLALARGAAAEPITIPDQDSPVVDTAGVLDPATREKLVDWLHELKQKTPDQIKVLTVPSLAGDDIVDFSQRHFDLWKLGTKKTDQGALIVLAIAEHKIRIHTGYGLEAALPDSFCGTLSRQVAKKYFAHGQYAEGLAELTQAVVQRAAADAGVQLTGVPVAAPQANAGDDLPDWVPLIVFLIIFLLILYSNWRNRGNRGRWATTQPGWGWSTFPTGGWYSGGSSTGGGWGGGGSDFGGGGSSGGGGGGASW
jgi:uncharacterized protein